MANWLLFMQDKPLTKYECFPNLMIVLEDVYVAQMIINHFFHFYKFKRNSIVLKFLHKFVIKIDSYAQNVKCFVFIEKKYSSCQH